MSRHDMVNEEILQCDCGCGFLQVEQFKDDGYTILSYSVPAFYAYQDGWLDRFKRNWGLIWSVLTGKSYRLFEIIIENQDDLARFKAFVAQMEDIKKDGTL